MKWMSIILGLLVACGCLARAESTDQGDHARGGPTPTTHPQGRPGNAENFRPRLLNGAPTDQQIADAEDFLKTYSPNRYNAYKKVMADHAKHPFIQRGMVSGYLQLQYLQTQDAKLYQMKVDELGLEDQIFGIVSDARESGQKLDRKSLGDQLRDPVQKLIEKRQQEAKRRIQRMQQALDNETKSLEKLQTADAATIVMEQEIDSDSRLPLGIVGGGNGRPLPPRLDGNPTTRSVDADQIPPNK